METKKGMVPETAELLLQTMRDVRDKKVSADDAKVIAQLGVGVIAAANAEVQFIRATQALPKGGIFGDEVKFLEP